MKRAKLLASKRRALFVCVVLVVGVVVGFTPQYGVLGSHSVADAGTGNSGCGVGEALSKCGATTSVPNIIPGGGSTVPTVISSPAPVTRACATSFFDQDDEAALTNQFGGNFCLFVQDTKTWVVVGSGESVTSPTAYQPTPGGSMIAVERCAANDQSCLDPNVVHSFSNFTVYFPPVPSSGDLHLLQFLTPTEMQLSVAFCGVYVFDTANGEWYAGNTSAPNNDEDTTQASIPTPSPESGKQAESTSAPKSVGSCEASIAR